jgi:hypothetical protein
VVKDNVFSSLATTDGASAFDARGNNLVAAGSRSGSDIVGRPRYAGGPDPWSAHRLADGSPGRGAASDGGDIGIMDRAPSVVPPVADAPAAQPPSAPATAPAVALVRPKRGAVVASRIVAQASGSDDSGIARLEVWVGADRRLSLKRSSFRGHARLPRSVRRGLHTVVVRAFARDGGVASSAVTIVRRGRASTRPDRKRAWSLASRPSGDTTVFRGRGPARARITVTLTRCADGSGRVVSRVRLRAGRDRIVSAVQGPGLCILRLRPS